jgi:hypothetical protein
VYNNTTDFEFGIDFFVMEKYEAVFEDESGDVGFTKHSSENFVLTFLFINNCQELERKIKRFRKKLFARGKRTMGDFHAAKEERRDILDLHKILIQHGFKVKYYIYKKKEEVVYQDEVINCVRKIRSKSDKFFLSKYDTRKVVNDKIREAFPDLEINIENTQKNVLLQMADLLSWSMFQNLEKGNSEYWELFKNFVEFE